VVVLIIVNTNIEIILMGRLRKRKTFFYFARLQINIASNPKVDVLFIPYLKLSGILLLP